MNTHCRALTTGFRLWIDCFWSWHSPKLPLVTFQPQNLSIFFTQTSKSTASFQQHIRNVHISWRDLNNWLPPQQAMRGRWYHIHIPYEQQILRTHCSSFSVVSIRATCGEGCESSTSYFTGDEREETKSIIICNGKVAKESNDFYTQSRTATQLQPTMCISYA